MRYSPVLLAVFCSAFLLSAASFALALQSLFYPLPIDFIRGGGLSIQADSSPFLHCNACLPAQEGQEKRFEVFSSICNSARHCLPAAYLLLRRQVLFLCFYPSACHARIFHRDCKHACRASFAFVFLDSLCAKKADFK